MLTVTYAECRYDKCRGAPELTSKGSVFCFRLKCCQCQILSTVFMHCVGLSCCSIFQRNLLTAGLLHNVEIRQHYRFHI